MKLYQLSILIPLFAAMNARADVPPLLPVQGYLTLADGTPIDAPTPLRFSIYATATSSSAMFVEASIVPVVKGHFSVYLGEATPLSLSSIRDASALWLGMAVDQGVELAPRVRLATMPFAAEAEYCREAETLSGAVAADFATVAHTHDWSELTSIPADLADGDDDTNTTYSAGSGLSLNGTTFSADTSVVQSRVTDTCPPGSSMRVINANGDVTCEDDNDSGGTITGVTPGFGITGGGTSGSVSVAVNDSVVQRRVTGACASGQFMQGVNQNGSVTCNADGDTMAGIAVTTEYSASRFNTGGSNVTSMVSTTRGFCFLTRQQVRETDSLTEGAMCRIVSSGGVWELEAVLEQTNDADVECGARCVTW